MSIPPDVYTPSLGGENLVSSYSNAGCVFEVRAVEASLHGLPEDDVWSQMWIGVRQPEYEYVRGSPSGSNALG